MKLPAGLINKYRISQVLIEEDFFWCAKVFDFSLNKIVLLTILKNIEPAMFDIIKEKFKLERMNENYDCVLEVFELDYLPTKELYYTQELGESLIKLDPRTLIGDESIRDWFYKLALPVFFKFLDMSVQKNTFHGFISPKTIYYSNGSFKIGDCILGIFFAISPQTMIASPWYYDSFFSVDLSGRDLDAYALLKILRFIDVDNYSKVMNVDNCSYEHTDFATEVKEIIDSICGDQEFLFDKFLSNMKPFLKAYGLLKKEKVLYKSDHLPLLYNMMSSWDMNKFKDVIVIHINHYLKDIIEFNKVLASIFEDLVYVVVPYSVETKIKPSQLYHTYYHEVNGQEFVIKKNLNKIQVASDFYSAMYESIKLAFRNEVIPSIDKGMKVLIIEDGGFHYNVIDELIKSYPILRGAIIGAIEQTTSGVKRYRDTVSYIDVFYPVLSVARSKIKMRVESHFIARRVVDELNYLLYMANNFLSFHNILIIGYGIVGRNISQALSALKCNVIIYDIEDSILSLAKNDGAKTIDNVQDIQFMDNLIIIGATGESAFTSSMFFSFVTSNAKKIFLASASSKRIEFQCIVDFFELGDKDDNYKQIIAEMENIRIDQKNYGVVYSFRYKNIDKKIVLIANGYPVNFYRKNIISLTESIIDLIYCEICLLIDYWLKNKLRPKLYLLGASELSVLDVEEEQLVRSWFNLLCLHFDNDALSIWDKFDVHPLEDFLRERCIPMKEKGNE